ncbi:MAG TPA: TPM domain-containing protein [Saprospiraceae bacterium]|nr:TPM domain-containing protein [Saprospiraceae bacterium]
MKKKILNLLLFLFLFSFQWGMGQEVFTIESVPIPTNVDGGFLSDPAHYLQEGDYRQIRRLLQSIEKSTTAQVAVVLLPSIGEESSKDFATRLFEHWGIGYQDKDNGLLILSVMDQRRTEFETGYGMEAVLPDAYCYRIGMQKMVPAYQKGDFAGGIMATLQEIKRILEDPESIADIRSNRKISNEAQFVNAIKVYTLINILFHLGLLVWVLLTLYSKTEYYDKYYAIKKVKWVIFMFLFPIPYILVYFLLGRLLKHLRYAPRFSKETGAELRLLTEDEEDDFLEAGQITEEDIGAADYDVWVDETGKDLLILRYLKPFAKYKNCPECNYKTYHLAQTVIIREASYRHDGYGERIYECKNCHYQHKQGFVISRGADSGGGGGFSGGGGGSSSFGGGGSGGGGASVSW